jgi:hypothetical protein
LSIHLINFISARAEQFKQETSGAAAAVKRGKEKQGQLDERARQRKEEEQRAKENSIQLMIGDIEKIMVLPDDLKDALVKGLRHDSVKIPIAKAIKPTKTKVKLHQSRNKINEMNTQKDFLIQQIKGLLTDKETLSHPAAPVFPSLSLLQLLPRLFLV